VVGSKIAFLILYLLSIPSPELNESEYEWMCYKAFCSLMGACREAEASDPLSRVFPEGTPLVDVLALWSPMAQGSQLKDEDEK